MHCMAPFDHSMQHSLPMVYSMQHSRPVGYSMQDSLPMGYSMQHSLPIGFSLRLWSAAATHILNYRLDQMAVCILINISCEALHSGASSKQIWIHDSNTSCAGGPRRSGSPAAPLATQRPAPSQRQATPPVSCLSSPILFCFTVLIGPPCGPPQAGG